MDVSQKILVKELLASAIKQGAYDIHFSVGNYPMLRVGRDLQSLEDQQMIDQDFMQKLADFLLTKEQQEKLKRDKEIIFSYSFDNELRFKVNIFYQRSHLSATLRYIPNRVPTLRELGLPEMVAKLTKLERGLVIISGTFGSGRSSTAAAIIEEVNRTRKKYIITIEDPIEYIFSNNLSVIEQREVGQDTNSFIDALKYFQEEDGDVLYLEQITQPEVIPLVLDIASNSLVLTSMAADSAAKTVSLLLDSFTSYDQERIRDLLANSLQAVVCQKIIAKNGGGVKAICEILLINDSVKSIISHGNINQLENLIQTSRKDGMVTFAQALSEAVRAGEISLTEALEHATDREALKNLIS